MLGKEPLILIGGGGHAKSVIDVIREKGEFHIIGVLDQAHRIGEYVNGVPIIGEDASAKAYFEQGIKYAFVSLGSIGNTRLRRKITKRLKKIGFTLPSIVATSAEVSPSAVIGEGTFVGKGVQINAEAVVGCHTIINTGAIVEHECHIGNFVHIAPGAVLCGNVNVAEDTHIGARSVVIQGMSIGRSTVIGAGSVVVKNIGQHKVAYGSPCKEERANE